MFIEDEECVLKNSFSLQRQAVFQDTLVAFIERCTAILVPFHIAFAHSFRCVSSQSTHLLATIISIFGTLFSPLGALKNSFPLQRGAVLRFCEN